MSQEIKKVGIIGLGVMGAVLLERMRSTHKEFEFWAATKSDASAKHKSKQFGIPVVTDFEPYLPDTDLLFFAVKPAQLEKVLKRTAKTSSKAIVCSLAAGIDTARIEKLLPNSTPVLRVMPNTPCSIGEGVVALCGGQSASAAHIDQIENILACLGSCFQVEERLFNAVTGLSGSGPAYVYLMLEALADGGVRVGLPREIALQMVAQTMLGAAKMARTSERHPAALRDEVTTPAGCTIGGLLIMEDGRIRSILARAIEEATRIAAELGNPTKQ